jgi:tetratricopeptide (TPR) repeat protein
MFGTPQSAFDRYERGRLFFEMGDYITAVEELQPVVDEAPKHVAARLLLARAYYHSAQLRKAEAAVREVIAQAPDEAYAYLMLGRVLQRQSRHEEATGPLRMAATMNPDLAQDQGASESARGRSTGASAGWA